MVRVIMDDTGSGKTKQLIELANSAVQTEHGNVVCIEPKKELTFDLDYNVRLIAANEYTLPSYEAFQGFLSGIYAGNYDITHVFIDNQEMDVHEGSVSMMMQKGEHLYRVEAPEHESQSGTINLGDEMVSKTVTLKPLFGYLEVLTQPEDSFSVYVNDSLIGYSPIRDYRLPIDEYIIHLEKDEFKPHDAKFGIFSGRTSHEQYTLITTRKPEGFPIRLSLEYLFSKTSYHGVRVAYGGRFGAYFACKWGEYYKAGTNIDKYDLDTDVSHAKKLGYIRRAYTGGVRLGLVKKKLPLYAYLGGGYGEYGRQWQNLTEIDKNIYFYSDYLRGFEGELGLSCVLFDWISISAGTSALFAHGKMSVDFQLCGGLSLNQTKLFKHKKKK